MPQQKLRYHKATKRVSKLDPTESKNIYTNAETFWTRIEYNKDIVNTVDSTPLK